MSRVTSLEGMAGGDERVVLHRAWVSSEEDDGAVMVRCREDVSVVSGSSRGSASSACVGDGSRRAQPTQTGDSASDETLDGAGDRRTRRTNRRTRNGSTNRSTNRSIDGNASTRNNGSARNTSKKAASDASSVVDVSPGASSSMDSPADAPFGLAPLEQLHPNIDQDDALDDEESPDEYPEMMYVTDELGNMLTLKDPGTWNKWLYKNCPNIPKERLEKSSCPWLVGRNLFEYIDCEKVASFTRHIIYMLGTGQQENYKYFWFCDTDTKERKMIMNVSSYSAFDDSRLIVWASKVIYEKDLAVPENYVQANCVPLKPTSKDPTATHVPSSTTSTIPPSSGTTSTNAFHSASPTTLTPTSTTVSLPPRLPQKVLPNRCVCSYCKRIMVLTDDIPPHITRAILAASASLPAAIVYDGPLPVLGARGRAGVQPALPKNASLEDGTEGMHAVGGVTPSLMEAVKAGGGPVQLSVQGVVNHLWLSPHLYYNVARLDDAIEIHNGVCEVCYAEIGWLFFKRGTFVNGVRVLAEECLGAEKRRLEVAERAVEVEKRELVNAAGSGLKRKDAGVGENGVLPVKRVGGEDLSGEKKRVRSIVPRPAHVPANVM